MILPVSYVLDGESVLIRVRVGSQLDFATQESVVAFEVDDCDRHPGHSWSVAATGVAREIVDSEEMARARSMLESWSGADDDHVVRISLDLITGRRGRLPAGLAPVDGIARRSEDSRPAVAETHAGIVFLVGDRAYKLKKAQAFDFLDFRSREAREHACQREVALNRRLAPDVYEGVANIVGVDGSVCDHLVVMQRMPASRRMSSMVERGVPVANCLAELAEVLARFHAGANRGSEVDEAASAGKTLARWAQNNHEMEPFWNGPLDSQMCREIAVLAHRYISGRWSLFERRVQGAEHATGMATCSRRTSSASMTGHAYSIAWSSTTACDSATCWPMSRFWPWT